MLTKIEQEVQDYNEKIKEGDYPKLGEYCRNCKKKPGEFKLHDHRPRKLRIIVHALVQIITTCLVRWRCPLCNAKFTAYPDFIVRHKRYAVNQIVEQSENLLTGNKSYEKALHTENSRIGYPESSKFVHMKKVDKEDESYLAASTLWRWCSWLGSFSDALSKALDIILQISPQSKIHRELEPLKFRRYRSIERKTVLEIANKVLQMREKKIGEKKFFPSFAIGI